MNMIINLRMRRVPSVVLLDGDPRLVPYYH